MMVSSISQFSTSTTTISTSSVELKPTYYLDNFLHLIHHVNSLYRDLLSEYECSFIDEFLQLSIAAQCLYIRLSGRRGDLFRIDKIHYEEIADIPSAVAELTTSRYFGVFQPEQLSADFDDGEWLALFTKNEMEQWLSCGRRFRRDELEQLVLQQLNRTPQLITQWIKSPVVCVYGEQELQSFRLLFFGNLQQSLTDFVLRDLGIYRYQAYALEQPSRWCQSRVMLEHHLEYFNTLEIMGDVSQYQADALLAWSQAFPVAVDDELLKRKLDRTRLLIARQLERLADYDGALSLYAVIALHPARERSLRLLVKLKQWEAALALAVKMNAAPMSEEELQFLHSFVPRAFKPVDIFTDPNTAVSLIKELTSKPIDISTQTIYLASEQRSRLGVEIAALSYLQEQYPCQAYYCENALIPSVFGLYFWDVIFAPITGAFYHPFQIRPADLYDDDFIAKRQTLFARRWQQLEQQSLVEFVDDLAASFTLHQGKANPFVHWEFLTAEFSDGLLVSALQAIPRFHWLAMFRFILKDLRHHRSGLPDLIVFNSTNKNEHLYELIEVKGPGDTLQKNQQAWLQCFARAGIPASVLYVRDGPK
ncbi:MAG: VRR-NUC domain-containing protein [Thalassobium sp.]|jgi:hypothetical protein|uniref:phosphodiesterase I n=1 Tax=hydrothermal vent metagenome TaxID=652676 RepID=A0A160THM0_9ZZZZ|nr:VRR-NUC domain-containing protein [Thalassolituus oleivorans]APR66359.1 hypothetical protein CN03_05065 [Thalassolituus oleivorans]PHQ87093.1 MAG: VRR-NUC domain-containing protein [Thalassobium sp.]